jgi:hypothetical protein
MVCRHCGHRTQSGRPRGLCWSCYYTPEVRARYPAQVIRGVGLFAGPSPQPMKATRALPGSPEKVAVLEQRARLGQELWHPQDAGMG